MTNTVISTFAGGGGSSLGYKMAGFKELLAIDFEKNAVDTLKANYDFPVWQRDISTVTPEEIFKATGIKKGELDVLDGSPPCQGFSLANTKRVVGDERNDLVYEFIRLIKGLEPKTFVIENVAGMVTGKMAPTFYRIVQTLKSLNYRVEAKLMNAMYYGVPQSRQRVIIIGVRKDLKKIPSFPKASSKNLVTLSEALPHIDGYIEAQFERAHIPGTKPVGTITKTTGMMFIKNNKKVRPDIDDVKVLCSFPRDYILTGGYTAQWARLGNAVCPAMMKAIATNIKRNILN